jgi:Type IV secretory system Conjugative DNA transfer
MTIWLKALATAALLIRSAIDAAKCSFCSSCQSVSSLLTWRGSAIVHDIKGENWTLTAGWRSRFSAGITVRPDESGILGFNPLLEVRRGDASPR